MVKTRVKAADLREKSKAELLQTLANLKKDLLNLKVQHVGGAGSSSGLKIKEMRKNVARVLTVISQTERKKALEEAKGKRIPYDLRFKKTRAIRRKLSRSDRNVKTVRQQKRLTHLARRQYAVKA
ncbi:60S ribosomal protein L35 [Smittium mucronatum]|uniref:60S ribosomal protein L35 n=1 Tax=Smittium mucronatum TaxID=133383 RepID=A0A1R0GSI9_9FUNG|nr:60S ribosomal protein L35 [Smittium mucronatum]